VFGLKQALFGRKGVAPGSGRPRPSPVEEEARNGAAMTYADVKARCASIGRREGGPPHLYVNGVITGLSPEERGAVLVSAATETDCLGRYWGDPAAPEYWPSRCHDTCLRMEVAVAPEQLPALLTLMVANKAYEKYYHGQSFAALLRLIKKAIADGGFLTSADVARLAEFSVMLRAEADKQRDKPKQKALLKRAELIEKLGSVEVSATSLLMERCEGAENPHAPGDAPPNLVFWSSLLAAFAEGLHEIRGAFQAAKVPAWMKSQAAFEAAWPAAGPIAPRFGAWEEGDDKVRGFAVLRELAKRRGKVHQPLVEPERVRRLPELRALYAPTFRWVWNTPQIPALERLADLERPGWTELLEHLITARMAPRPTATWRKQAVALADAIGRDEVRARLADWLQLFHSPPLNPISLADRTNAEAIGRQVETLNEALPDWPQRIAPEEIPAVGRALAMVAASGAGADLSRVLAPNFLECDDHRWEGKSASEGQLRLPSQRWNDKPGNWLQVSLENETLLRGAIWLATEILDRADVIATLEAVALSASARLHLSDGGQRSKVLANAAIATLIDLGGSDVDQAVYRLSQAIPDRTINAALFKALNRGGEAQPASE